MYQCDQRRSDYKAARFVSGLLTLFAESAAVVTGLTVIAIVAPGATIASVPGILALTLFLGGGFLGFLSCIHLGASVACTSTPMFGDYTKLIGEYAPGRMTRDFSKEGSEYFGLLDGIKLGMVGTAITFAREIFRKQPGLA